MPHQRYTTRLKERKEAAIIPIEVYKARGKCWGLRISEITGMYAVVPALHTNNVVTAFIPSTKLEEATATKPRSNGPSWGAATGRSRRVTPTLQKGVSVTALDVIWGTLTQQ